MNEIELCERVITGAEEIKILMMTDFTFTYNISS